ncbi:MAG: ABC transporter permease [Bacillota bacterium]
MWKKFYRNSGKYVRLLLRRDRFRILIWLLAIVLLTLIVAPAYTELASTEQERITMAETMQNPAVTAMFGPGYGLDDYTYGAMMGHQMLLFTALAVSIMSILLVARQTRADEESGRIEMIRSLPVGRLSSLCSTILVLWGTSISLALLTGLGLYALGIEGIDLHGSLLYGAALGAAGIFFTAVAALFAQLAESSRGTVGLSMAALGLFYLLRAVGDVGNETLSWLSPLGWILRSEVYVNNYWWPIGLTVAASLAVTALAFYLNSIRDLGAGFLPSRPGRKTASRFLQSPLGLAWKLQRNGIIAWMIGMFILGASYGSIMGDLESYLASLEMMREMLPDVEGFTLTEQFIPMLMSVLSSISVIPALLMITKLRAEENKNRKEQLLARAVSRLNLLGSYLSLSIITGALALLLAGTGLWSAAVPVMEDPVSFETIFNAAMVYYPALLVMIGVAVLFMGFKPEALGIAWLYLGYSFFVVYLGQLLDLPEWLSSLTPFGYVPRLPIEEMDYTGISILTVLALGLIVAGFLGYRRRDIQG